MNALILTLVFATAAALAASVTLAFSPPIDGVLPRLISGDMARAWSQYVKFALFTASLAGGLRPMELSGIAAQKTGAIAANQGVLEVFKTILGSLEAASWTLLAFFGATLAVYAASRAYESFRAGTGKSAYAPSSKSEA